MKGEQRELEFNGYKVSAGKDEKGLEMDGSNSCTTMCLMSQSCTLKMVKTVNFILYVFKHNKKK